MGVILDDQLSFEDQVLQVHKKVSKSIAMIHNLREHMPEYVLKALYHAHIEPHLTYCINIWGSTYATHIQHLHILQKRAVRIINKRPLLEHSLPLFRLSRILTIYDLVKLNTATLYGCSSNSRIGNIYFHDTI